MQRRRRSKATRSLQDVLTAYRERNFVCRLHGDGGPDPHEDHAARLAGELSRLLDQVETEGLDLAALSRLVPADYAEHWQITLAFLEILTLQWPRVQDEEGVIGAAERRRRLIEARTRAWRATPPGHVDHQVTRPPRSSENGVT